MKRPVCAHALPLSGKRAGSTAERGGNPLVLTAGMVGARASPHTWLAVGMPPGSRLALSGFLVRARCVQPGGPWPYAVHDQVKQRGQGPRGPRGPSERSGGPASAGVSPGSRLPGRACLFSSSLVAVPMACFRQRPSVLCPRRAGLSVSFSALCRNPSWDDTLAVHLHACCEYVPYLCLCTVVSSVCVRMHVSVLSV